jgi:hypothetical protein
LEGEVRGLINEAIELSYFMRGAIPYEAMMGRTYAERQVISEFITKRLEAETQKMYPNY